MVQYTPPPDHRNLLPPLLACLPTSFVSPRPPPALLPLLSPVLRQRVQLLAGNASTPSNSWLPLLCWESEPAQKLVDIIRESDAFELHPVSGEIDFGDVEQVTYRRLDEETLQARVVLVDLELVVIYLWCKGDQEGGGNGWRVSEVRPSEDQGDISSNNWWPSMQVADAKAQEKMMHDALRHGEDNTVTERESNVVDDEQNDDDAYWAQYDDPQRNDPKRSPGPGSTAERHNRTTSEADYYERYAQVQPEMDNDDPFENRGTIGESTLNGDAITSSVRQAPQTGDIPAQSSYALPNASGPESAEPNISHPTVSSTTDGPAAISRLENSAASQSSTEMGVRQHLSNSIKSLFRLARSSGIDRLDFDRMVRTELETLSMMEEDD
ncbi:hypothetical protein MMC28_005893 [Mycoblastus sanguinarius]|nr:hypothetical protein [Mycoblastus sanguinarius]